MAAYKIPKHNSLDGQTIEYGGQKFTLSQNNSIKFPINIPSPKINLNPQMRFDADENGKLVLRINPNPTMVYGNGMPAMTVAPAQAPAPAAMPQEEPSGKKKKKRR